MKETLDGNVARPASMADPRFVRVHTDPRFQRMPKNKTKVSIDSRFAHMFSDKNFSDPLGVDKRGRSKKKTERHLLQRYYKIDEAEEKDGEGEDEENRDLEKGIEKRKDTKVNGRGGKENERVSKRGQKEKSEQKRIAIRGLTNDKKELRTVEILGQNSGPEVSEHRRNAETLKGSSNGGTLKPVIEEGSDGGEESDEREDENDLKSSGSEEVERQQPVADVVLSSEDGDDSASEVEVSDAGLDSVAEQSSSSSSSESEAESDREEEEEEEEETVPTTVNETQRIAMMNMDWEHIKAVDLLMLMRSFLPKMGNVKSVTVYPSEFGLEQIKDEEVHGPKAVFNNEAEEEEDDKELDMEKLRTYEKNKLKYYYAVVECDSKATANHLYTQCDGMEFERTSNTLDLRFIPDEMKFERAPRDVADEVPDNYKAPEFETRALQHSSVKLTWDDDEPTRVKALRRKFNSDQLNEMDFRSYLASESEEEEEEEEEVDDVEAEEEVPGSEIGHTSANRKLKEGKSKNSREKYRGLLLGEPTEDALVSKKSGKGDMDMEVTFYTGLSELSEKLLQKQEGKKRGDETVWEAYLRKKKEKKSQKRRAKNSKNSDAEDSEDEILSPRRGSQEPDPFFTHDENGFDDPFFASDGEAPRESKRVSNSGNMQRPGDEERTKKREEKEQKKKEEERSRAELELLLMDDEAAQPGVRGFNLKSKKKKEKGKKKKHKDETQDDNEEDDKLASANLDDPRFGSLFSNHHFAIDPTNPQFRKSTMQLKILAEAQRRREQAGVDTRLLSDASNIDKSYNGDVLGHPDRKRKAELSSLVRSLKGKVSKGKKY